MEIRDRSVDIRLIGVVHLIDSTWFDRIWKKSAIKESVQYVFYQGRYIDREEYLKRKYRQYGMLQERRMKQ